MSPCKGLDTLTCDDIGHITTHIMMEQANITGVQEQPTESAQAQASHLSAGHTATETQYVCFMLAGGEYGVEISCVLQILKPTMEPTPVPPTYWSDFWWIR